MPATRPYLPHLLLGSDFDSTPGRDSIDAILKVCEISRSEYERNFVEALGADWDAVIKQRQGLIDLVGQDPGPCHARCWTKQPLGYRSSGPRSECHLV